MTEPHAAGGIVAIRGAMLSFTRDPFADGDGPAYRHEPDAVVAMAGGRITHAGPAAEVLATLPPGTPVTSYGRDALIVPGFIDCHVHYPQVRILGAGGEPLLGWLAKHAFRAEQRLADVDAARETARVFLRECLRHGTTTAAVYCTVHPHSATVFLEEAERLGLRMIAGKVLMDRQAPADLCDTPQRGYDESKALIAAWHGRGRALYAVTPRWAGTSTPEQLEVAGALWREHPGTYLQTHIAETREEVALVTSLFPERRGFLDIYDHYGLVGPRAILGHGIWLTDAERKRLREAGAALAHCPTSNLFLGSGLLDLSRATAAAQRTHVGVATDLGAGTSFSMLRTLGEAYKVARLRGGTLRATEALYLATRGAAAALHLDDRIGSVEPGLEADLAVLDLASTPFLAWRGALCESLEELLFVQLMLGDDRAVRATYAAGALVHAREPERQPGDSGP
ncbi:MAG TPA: guanine deaminase [Gemmatimonadales bacterium]|nr:guanine deaminase [Gemmatimonadales bacterium]